MQQSSIHLHATVYKFKYALKKMLKNNNIQLYGLTNRIENEH